MIAKIDTELIWAAVLIAIVALLVLYIAVGGMRIGGRIGEKRGRKEAGQVLGLIWPLGWLIAAILPRTKRARAEYEVDMEEEKERVRKGLDNRP